MLNGSVVNTPGVPPRQMLLRTSAAPLPFLMDRTDQHCRASHRSMRRRTPLRQLVVGRLFLHNCAYMPGDGSFLARRDHPNLDGARTKANKLRVAVICFRIEFEAQPT
jgi:hypothetical protein